MKLVAKISRLIPVAAFAGLAGMVMAGGAGPIIVSTSLVSPNDKPNEVGDALQVKVAITANPSGEKPTAGAFRVYFDDDALSWGHTSVPGGITVDPRLPKPTLDNRLGEAFSSTADEYDGSLAFRDVVTAGPDNLMDGGPWPITSDSATPVVFYVWFTILQNAPAYDITIAEDPDAVTLPMLTLSPPSVSDLAEVHGITFDNSATTNIASVADWTVLD